MYAFEKLNIFYCNLKPLKKKNQSEAQLKLPPVQKGTNKADSEGGANTWL